MTAPERGETGEQGIQGTTGERGPVGDHGQTGDRGIQGARGPRASTFITRNLVVLFLLITAGNILSFVAIGVTDSRNNERVAAAIDYTNEKAREFCEAGNARSRILSDDYTESRRQAEQTDLVALLGITPEQADELRRITLENVERRIAALPFLDCETGEGIPPAS